MNEHDLATVKFFLTATDVELAKWHNDATEDEHKYAMHLLQEYAAELGRHAQATALEWELEVMTEQAFFPEADEILSKYLH